MPNQLQDQPPAVCGRAGWSGRRGREASVATVQASVPVGVGPNIARPFRSERPLRSTRGRPRLPVARGPERHPGRGCPAHGGAGPDRGRGRLGQDPRAHAPHRLPDPREGRVARRHPGHHLHQQGPREMADRVEGLWAAACQGMWILTFHSACARILRREHTHLGIPSSFTIYDDGDTERLIAGVLKDLDLDPKRFPPKAMAPGSAARRTRCSRPTTCAQRRQLLRGDHREDLHRVRESQARGRARSTSTI